MNHLPSHREVLLGAYHPVDESEPVGFVGIDPATREGHLARPPSADRP
jgi:hypothetical protein